MFMRSSALAYLMIVSLAAFLSLDSQIQSPVEAQSLGGAVARQNLDLPYDAGFFQGDSSEEESAEVVNFYGQQYEGDGIFFAIDRSGSMQSSGELQIAKREVSKNITEFTNRVQFGIVFFDRSITKYPSSGRPAESTPSMKAGALNWLNSVPGGGGSCAQEGLVQAMQFANFATSQRRVVVYVGDGGGTCNGADEANYLRQTVSIIKAQNYQRAQVNAIGVLDVDANGEQFMRSLAASNGGSYTRINR